MQVIEVRGTSREIGRATGEAVRERIRERLELFPHPHPAQQDEFDRRLPTFMRTMRAVLPDVLEEIEGMAEGADLSFERVAAMNFPLYANELIAEDACTNLVFAGGPDGPIWGKNNDCSGEHDRQPVVCRKVAPKQGMPFVDFTFCGSVCVGDGMNAEGLAMGHSSVGSRFQQSDHHVGVRLWAYQCMRTCRTTAEALAHMASRPTRGKGYSWVVVDRHGSACSIEAACPLAQVRRSSRPDGHLHCLNLYQLPLLLEADRRKPAAKELARKRWAMLDAILDEPGERDLAHMQRLIRHHGAPSVCRHGGHDSSYTQYAMIGLPAQGRVLFREGNPCEGELHEIRI